MTNANDIHVAQMIMHEEGCPHYDNNNTQPVVEHVDSDVKQMRTEDIEGCVTERFLPVVEKKSYMNMDLLELLDTLKEKDEGICVLHDYITELESGTVFKKMELAYLAAKGQASLNKEAYEDEKLVNGIMVDTIKDLEETVIRNSNWAKDVIKGLEVKLLNTRAIADAHKTKADKLMDESIFGRDQLDLFQQELVKMQSVSNKYKEKAITYRKIATLSLKQKVSEDI